jgi:hypothetical protein
MNDINFFSIYSNKNSVAFKRKRLTEIGLAGLLAVILLYAGLFAWLYLMEVKTQEINDYLTSEKVQKQIAESDQAMTSLTATQEYNNAAAGLLGNMDKMNNLTTETLDIISKSLPVTAKVETINYSDGIFSFGFSAPSMQVVAQTVVRLEETEIFHDVVLQGALLNEAKTGYNFNISAMMKVGEQ